MINPVLKTENSNNFNKSIFRNTAQNSNNISLFYNNSQSPCENTDIPPHKMTTPVKVSLYSPSGDTIFPVPETDAPLKYNDPAATVDIEFYSSGKPHYIRDYYNGVITRQIEYMGDGTVVTVDEYIDGVLRKHTENYPGSGEKWIVQEYNEKGKLIRSYEYKPNGEPCGYIEFPEEE